MSEDGDGTLTEQLLHALILHERNAGDDRDVAAFVQGSAHAVIVNQKSDLRLLHELDAEAATRIATTKPNE